MNDFLDDANSSEEEAGFLIRRIEQLEKAIWIHKNLTNNPSESDIMLWRILQN